MCPPVLHHARPRKSCLIIKSGKHDCVLNKYPQNYSNSYDFIMRAEEIVSGAQRIHDHDLLQKQVCCQLHVVNCDD